jgi:cation diffusion facilitator CzcD-associated flavoprotein CzcO
VKSKGLTDLEDALRRELERLAHPGVEWVPPHSTCDGERIVDVAIVGGGQSGLAVAASLRCHGVANILVFDENPQGRAGPWLSYARMRHLRTPKEIVGIDAGIPNLTVQAWYEAAFGQARWNELGTHLPTEVWAHYLEWYRQVLQIPYRSDVRVGAISWEHGYFRLPLSGKLGETSIAARKVVLANGLHGAGRWFIPPAIANGVSRQAYAHASDPIDFTRLAGKRVAVVGAGATGFDNAATALEEGAREVHLLCRRDRVPIGSPYRWGGQHTGFLRHHGELRPEARWRFAYHFVTCGEAPPQSTLDRVAGNPAFHLHEACSVSGAQTNGSTVQLVTNHGDIEVDFVILATRFTTDLSSRPELAGLWREIALWEDRYTPPADEQHADLGRHPYLGAHFEFEEKVSGTVPYLRSMFCFNWGALPSLGFAGGNIPGLKYGTPRLVHGITGQLYCEDIEDHFAQLSRFTGQ